MKRRFTILTAAIALLAFLAIPMGMWGQTRTEEVLSTCRFGASYNQGNSSYTGTFVVTNGSYTWTVGNGNNNNNGWTNGNGYGQVKFGRKNVASVGYITTNANYSEAITKVELTIDAITSSKINSIKLYTSTNNSAWTEAGSFTKATGVQTVSISSPTVDLYYKIEFDCASGTANGLITVSKVDYYYNAGSGLVIATPTFDPAGGDYATTQNVTISCETEGSTIYYTTDGSTPDNTSTQYTAAISVSSTTTINAIAYVGNDASSVASATYTIMQPLTTMQAIFDKATEVGSTATYTYITLGDWVVSGVSTNGKNVFVTDGTKGFVIFDNGANMGFAAGDILSGTVYCKVQLYNGFAELTLLNSTTDGVSVTTGGTVTAANIAMADLAGVNTGALVHYENLTCSIDNNKYYLSDGTTTIQVYNSIYAFGSTLVADHVYNITGVYQQYTTNNANTKEVLPRSAADIEEVVSAEPSVTVTPTTINAPYEGAEGTLALTYENIEEFISFDYYFCDAEGEELEEGPDWIYAEIQEEDDTYSLYYLIDANDGAARTAYLKVYTFDDNFEEVYAIVTINQAEFVIDYAELPFEWSSFDETPTGITNNGVTISGYLKFDTSGDNIILKFNERPGTLDFNVKGNPGNNGWAGTFKVQTSVDGVSYTDLATYDDLSTTEYQGESFDNLNENVRYIKWVYTEKVSGNVAVNYISLAEYVAPIPAITVDSTTITATAEETEGTLNVTYTAIETDLGIDVFWYESDGTTTATEPDWILAEVNSELNVDYVIEANNGEARTAYFKLYGLDGEANSVYSELVTITQAAAPQQYTLTVEPFENLEIITFVDDEMVLETAGEIQVNEGAHIMLSIVADEGYVMETLMVNGVNHVNDIAEDFTYEFDMPAEAVTISATAVEQVAPVGGDYVRITSLDQLTDGSIVVIAARYDEEHTNGYYAMSNATSGKPTGVLFTSTTSGDNEILPASIVDNEDDYYWVVNETENGYTFTNAEGFIIGYNSSTNFATGGNNTEWSIELSTSEGTAMVPGYTGFFITNVNNQVRHFALNSSHNFGPYHDNNINNSGYNFCLDFFVQSEALPTETYTLTINGYEAGSLGGYYLIASPVTVDPASVGMTTGDFDLYYFDESEPNSNEWINYVVDNTGNTNPFNLEPGKGYLYAKKATTQGEVFHFTLTGTPYDGQPITLSKTTDAEFEGINLVGNPFSDTAYIADGRDFYIMNSNGTNILTEASTGAIAPMQGIFVYATDDEEQLTFSTEVPAGNGSKLVLNLSQGRGVVDRAIVRFGEGQQLPKFQLNENSTKLYIPQGDKDYAVVYGEDEGEMPLNFKAAEDGTYTLSFSDMDAEFSSLYLIDSKSRANIDLLANPSYTFDAQTTDDENRFTLVYEKATSYLTIGTGTNYSGSGANLNPDDDGQGSLMGNTYYTASTSQFVYMAEELDGAKTIEYLSFYHNNYGSFVGTVKIYLAHTTANQVYTNNPATSGTLVYEGTNINIGSDNAAWQRFTLDTPFQYNGTDNLLVIVCRTKATTGSPNYNANQGWRYSSYSQHYYFMERSGNNNNTYGDISSTGNYYRTFKRPNIRIGYSEPAVDHFDLNISGWTSNGNYYLIASPIGEVAPTAVTNMTSNSYDLYYFNQDGDDQGKEWITYKNETGATAPGFNLVPGKGYLYANSGVATNNPNVVTLTFNGSAYTGSGDVNLTYSETNSDPTMWGWNLVGNPFGVDAYIDRAYYVLNSDRTEVMSQPSSGAIGPMQGLFVHATQNETMTFSTTPSKSKGSMVALNLSQSNGIMDRAIINFGEGQQLPKFQINRNSTKVYIPMDDKDYAIVNGESIGEMPVSFKAEKNGNYTLSIASEEVSFNYLHLIDNMTGNDVDLLSTPSYSFEAKTTDYANRFKLVFVCGDANDDDDFAFFSNGSFVINNEGNATLQVIDVTGRMISSETINGCANVNVDAAPGVYMIRLVNGENVKVQKVVVR